MNYNFSEITFPSKDGIHTVYAELYTPKTKSAKAVIQLAHGMIDYVARYEGLADYLTGEGYIFAGNHHLGHGKTAGKSDDFGFFAEKDGVNLVLADMHTMNKQLRDMFPALPIIIMGHSMGSFLTRLYIEQYPHSIKGAIIHGTSGPVGIAPLGSLLAKAISKIRGVRYRSRIIDKMAFGAYNSKFPKSEGKNAWLTRDVSAVSGREDDKYTSFKFTASGFEDLLKMIRGCNRQEWFEKYPKELPTLIVSGDMDPVGKYGKGPDYVYKHLLISGCNNVELKLYEGARHELFNEINKEEVFSDLKEWLGRVVR